jgi:hypothetical protein
MVASVKIGRLRVSLGTSFWFPTAENWHVLSFQNSRQNEKWNKQKKCRYQFPKQCVRCVLMYLFKKGKDKKWKGLDEFLMDYVQNSWQHVHSNSKRPALVGAGGACRWSIGSVPTPERACFSHTTPANRLGLRFACVCVELAEEINDRWKRSTHNDAILFLFVCLYHANFHANSILR